MKGRRCEGLRVMEKVSGVIHKGGANFDPRDMIWAIMIEVNKTMLHAKYLNSTAFAF